MGKFKLGGANNIEFGIYATEYGKKKTVFN